ncbi:UvsY-like recombination mediator [Synechococcus phage S-T4]|jgi:hypothetical protein|uniref:Single stranded DNA-binding protein n=1 Tax=Synechococcus phage S-T4 TaxID=2268578 RepID=A0A385EHL5_9CAUD|nr:UvsY-like recombination mediator [Synechococcus phage S-T4]AXQ70572.1 single stranded DNA-binding protein [Synechococcus phage S-T4]
MNLEDIQKMWDRDSEIDRDDLANESLKTPQLHAKYYEIYNTTLLLRERAKETYDKVYLERYNYYTGKADPAVYEDEPFPYKVREKESIQRHMSADERLSKVDLKIKYYDIMLRYLEEIIKSLSNRGYIIKNAIDWLKFTSGM